MVYCNPCDRSFNSWFSYRQHKLNSSSHDYCGECDRDFDSPVGLRQHWIQSPEHSFCRKCDAHFDDDDELLEHCKSEHHYCEQCDRFFQSVHGLHEHNRQCHHYCVECRRVFNSERNLRSHVNSRVHRPKKVPCAFQDRGCKGLFISKSAMISHLEAEACASGATRRMVNRWAQLNDRQNIITDPQRLLEDTRYCATERSWNGHGFECELCHNSFRTLDDLNRHLASPRHQEKIYHCPLETCRVRFNTLSGLCQHVESESCGVLRFRIVKKAMDRLLGKMGRLRIEG